MFCFPIITLYAEENEKINTDSDTSKCITINPYCSDFTLKNVKYGDRIKFKICNLNTFKINASVKTEGIDYDFKETSGIIEEALKTIDTSEKNRNTNAFAGNTNNKTETNYIEFIKIAQEIVLRSNLEDILLNQINDSVFIKNIEALKEKCNSDYLVCYQEPNDSYNSKKNVQTSFEKLDTFYFAFKEEYDSHLNSLNAIFKTKFGERKDKDLKDTEKKEKETLSKKINDFSKTYSYADTLYIKLKDFKTRIAIIKKSFAGIDLYFRIKTEEFAIYTESEPAMSDEVIMRPTLKNYKGETLKEFGPYYIKTTGRLKVNFSTGYLLSFIGDDNFSIYTNSKDSIVGVRIGNSSKLTHSLGALAHVYCTNAGNANIAFSTGVSFTSNSSLGFYLGATGLFQEKNRLALTAGVSFTQVKRINTSNLDYDRHHHTAVFSSTSDHEIRYDLVYRPAFFIGVTYNLSEK